ncbi:hypothetical protein D920_02331 [Enterococcus faecalis 13-SD-W-01]|nr:hypothetical protein D920_02331 [Enterococcus faecalis 13-SD-W-01]
MYSITRHTYFEKEGFGVLHVDNLHSPFMRYEKVDNQVELLPKLFFANPNSSTAKVKKIDQEHAMFIAVQKNLKKLLEKGLTNEKECSSKEFS